MEHAATHAGRRALITGITGQDGSYLAEFLLAKGYEVWGMIRRSSTHGTDRLDHIPHEHRDKGARLHLHHGDLADTASLHRILKLAKPHEVYNLGAQSHVKVSFDLPEYTADVTGVGVLRLLEAIRKQELDARFFQASSSELFGQAVETPQRETTPFHPRSPYAAAKSFAFEVTRNYREAYGMFAVNGIMFNHESPRRGESFVTRKITLAAARIARGTQDCLYLGNLHASRDWGFAGDYVEGMWLMLQAEQPDDFVLATGQTHTVRDFCNLAFAHADVPLHWEGSGADEKGLDSTGRVLVEVDPTYYRPTEVDRLVGDAAKAERVLGWKPRCDLNQLVRMMVDHDSKTLDARR